MTKFTLFKKFSLFVIFALVFLAVFSTPVFAQEDSCPVDDDWIKLWYLDDTEVTYTAPEGKLVAETCQREGNTIIYGEVNPPQKTVTLISVGGGDIHHASFRLVDEDIPAPTSTPGQTCPATGDWVKVDDLSGFEYTYTAPDGFLVAETCWKAGTTVKHDIVDPPQKTVTIISTIQQELSHISVRLVPEVPTETPTEIPSQTPTGTPEETITPTPTGTITPTITPQFTPTITLTVTPRPTDGTMDLKSGGVGPSLQPYHIIGGLLIASALGSVTYLTFGKKNRGK